MHKKKKIINAMICGLGIFHVVDFMSKLGVIFKARTVTITTTNFIYSTAKPVLLLAIVILIYLILALISLFKQGEKKLMPYLLGAGGYSFLVFCDHAYRTRVDMHHLNFIGALIISSPVIVGAIALYYFEKKHEWL